MGILAAILPSNSTPGVIMVITFCFCVGDVGTILATPTNYAFIQLFNNSTSLLAATNAMTALVIIKATFCCITLMATASRQLCFVIGSFKTCLYILLTIECDNRE